MTNQRGSVLLQVMVTSVLVALIAASLLRMSMLRYQVTSRSAKALQGKRVEYERKRLGKDGREHYLAGSFIPDYDSAGRVSGFFGMIIDITERKQTERALRASEERWKYALEGAGEGVWDRNIQTGDVLYSRRY